MCKKNNQEFYIVEEYKSVDKEIYSECLKQDDAKEHQISIERNARYEIYKLTIELKNSCKYFLLVIQNKNNKYSYYEYKENPKERM